MELIFKGCVGAAITIVIALVAKTKFYYLAGLLPLFPSFAVIAHFISFEETGIQGLQDVLIFGIWSLFPYLVYLTSLYFFSDKLNFKYAISFSLLLWLLSACTIIIIWSFIKK